MSKRVMWIGSFWALTALTLIAPPAAVRADNFFGRTAILREILEGERDCIWTVGARRVGQTSLLKELEYRVRENVVRPYCVFLAFDGPESSRVEDACEPAHRGERPVPFCFGQQP